MYLLMSFSVVISLAVWVTLIITISVPVILRFQAYEQKGGFENHEPGGEINLHV